MMENVEELTKRGFTLDLPISLPVEEERNYGGDRRFGMRPGGGGRGGCVHTAYVSSSCLIHLYDVSPGMFTPLRRLPRCVSSQSQGVTSDSLALTELHGIQPQLTHSTAAFRPPPPPPVQVKHNVSHWKL